MCAKISWWTNRQGDKRSAHSCGKTKGNRPSLTNPDFIQLSVGNVITGTNLIRSEQTGFTESPQSARVAKSTSQSANRCPAVFDVQQALSTPITSYRVVLSFIWYESDWSISVVYLELPGSLWHSKSQTDSRFSRFMKPFRHTLVLGTNDFCHMRHLDRILLANYVRISFANMSAMRMTAANPVLPMTSKTALDSGRYLITVPPTKLFSFCARVFREGIFNLTLKLLNWPVQIEIAK